MKRTLTHMTFALFLTLAFLQTKAYATADALLFAQFPNPYFIETGTYIGDGVQTALDAGFEKVYSIELDPELFLRSRKRFLNNPKVKLYPGDSGKKLKDILREIRAPITFWLDAHFAGDGTAKAKVATPILEELDQIRMHPIKTHTLLIDDVRQFGTADFEYVTIEQVKAKILKINPNYQFTYVDGFVPNDILVAYVPDTGGLHYPVVTSSESSDSNTYESDDDQFIQEQVEQNTDASTDDDPEEDFSQDDSLEDELPNDVLQTHVSESDSTCEEHTESDSSKSDACEDKSRDEEGRSFRV